MPSPIRREMLDPDVAVGAGKAPCRLATTVNDTLSGLAARDGVTPVAGDRVFAKDQTTAADRGIYIAAAGAWARSEDFDDNVDADNGTIIPVVEGTANQKTSWQLTTTGAITIGVTALTFEIMGRAGNDPGAHGTNHDPGGSDAVTTAAASGLTADSANAEGTNTSLARSDHSHDIDTATGTISTVNGGDAASEGSAAGIARRDHQHAVATAAAGTIQPDDTAAEGASADLSRADHGHAIVAAAPAQGVGAGNSEGAATSFARSDHDHTVRESGGQDLTVGAIAAADLVERVGTVLQGTAAIDDTQHGNRGGGTLHADATTSVDGFLSAADKTKLDSIVDPRFRDFKESCQLKTQGNIALSAEQTIDGTLTSSSRVAVFDQSTGSQDGIYQSAAGAWTREADFQAGDNVGGAFFAIREGAADADKTFLVTNDTGTDIVGTDNLAVIQIGAGTPRGAGAGLVLNVNDLDVVANADGSLVVNANDMLVGVLATDAQHGVRGGGTQHADVVAAGADGFMTGADKTRLDNIETGATAETPQQEVVTTEAVTGTDTALADTLNATPKANAWVSLYLNGVFQRQGAGFDYTISGTTITWLASSGTAVNMKTGDTLDVVYVS